MRPNVRLALCLQPWEDTRPCDGVFFVQTLYWFLKYLASSDCSHDRTFVSTCTHIRRYLFNSLKMFSIKSKHCSMFWSFLLSCAHARVICAVICHVMTSDACSTFVSFNKTDLKHICKTKRWHCRQLGAVAIHQINILFVRETPASVWMSELTESTQVDASVGSDFPFSL